MERQANQSVSVFSCTAIIHFLFIMFYCSVPMCNTSVERSEISLKRWRIDRGRGRMCQREKGSVSVCAIFSVPCRCFHKFQHVLMWIPLVAPCCCAFHWEMQRRGGRKRWRYVTKKKDWWDKLQLEGMRRIKLCFSQSVTPHPSLKTAVWVCLCVYALSWPHMCCVSCV